MPDNGSSTPPGRGLLAVYQRCRASLTTLFGRISHRFGRISHRRDVDDILQEAFMRSFEGGGKPSMRSPRAFLLRTANVAFSHVSRQNNRLNARSEDLTLPEVFQLTTEASESQIEASQRFATICRAIGSLPEQCRRAFILKKVYGLDQQEIADRLAVPPATVEKHIATGLMKCREYIDAASRPVPGSGGDPDARKSGHRHRP